MEQGEEFIMPEDKDKAENEDRHMLGELGVGSENLDELDEMQKKLEGMLDGPEKDALAEEIRKRMESMDE